jgi:hypothetical protein
MRLGIVKIRRSQYADVPDQLSQCDFVTGITFLARLNAVNFLYINGIGRRQSHPAFFD